MAYPAARVGLQGDFCQVHLPVVNQVMIEVVKEINGSEYGEDTTVLAVCDYGCGTGRLSEPLVRKAITDLKEKYGQQREVLVIYNDNIQNDFLQLFQLTQGEGEFPRNGIRNIPGVFVQVVATCLHKKVLPHATVNLGFFVNSASLLGHTPVPLRLAIHISSPLATPEEVSVWKQEAEVQLKDFLCLRAAETKPGGAFILCTVVREREGHYTAMGNNTKYSVNDELEKEWAKLSEEGVISEEEFENTNIVSFVHEFDDVRRVATDREVIRAGFCLQSCRKVFTPCQFTYSCKTEKSHGKLSTFTAVVKSLSYDYFYSGLSNTRNDAQKKSVVDILFERINKKVEESPDDFGNDFLHGIFVFCKKRTD